jgi:hypothetical protein
MLDPRAALAGSLSYEDILQNSGTHGILRSDNKAERAAHGPNIYKRHQTLNVGFS